MNATLQADGSLVLESAHETRTVYPRHRCYARLMQLYQTRATVAPSRARAAPTPAQRAPSEEIIEQGLGDTWEPLRLSAGFGGFPWVGGIPEPDKVYRAPVACLHEFGPVEPERSFIGQFEPSKMGTLIVWRNPKDGRTYVVDGVLRLRCAKRAELDNVPVSYVVKPRSVFEARTERARLNERR